MLLFVNNVPYAVILPITNLNKLLLKDLFIHSRSHTFWKIILLIYVYMNRQVESLGIVKNPK